MKLFEAILIGSSLRPETHQERFCMIVNLGVLGSDAWGAACEAEHPEVARLNWNLNDKQALNSSLRYLNEIQHKYFEKYFQMPAYCPLAHRSILRGRGRVINRKGEYVVEDGAKVLPVAGVTDECHKVKTLAGLVDHAFYKHNNSREEVAEIAEFIENERNGQLIMVEHYKDNALMQRLGRQLTQAALQRARRSGRRATAGN